MSGVAAGSSSTLAAPAASPGSRKCAVVLTVQSPTLPCATVMRCVVEIDTWGSAARGAGRVHVLSQYTRIHVITAFSLIGRAPEYAKSGSFIRWRPGSSTTGCPF